MLRTTFTTHQVAKICDVHYTTVIKWVKLGKLAAYATPGGHRRIYHKDLIEFMERFNVPIPRELRDDKKRILIVDDDPEMLDELGEALSSDNIEIDCASDGFEAGRKIFGRIPDLVLLDFRMPGMNGFEVCKTLQMEKETSIIPIIAITVLKSKNDVKKIKECGVVKYMSKPVDIVRLANTINKILFPKHNYSTNKNP